MADIQLRKERERRYRRARKIEKFGVEFADADMRGRGRKASGPQHPRWSSEKMQNADGYVKVRVGVEHPLADPNGYAYEHLLVWCAAGRPRPAKGMILHHQNETRDDNRLSNLELLTRAEHNRLHMRERRRDPDTGRVLPREGA